MDLNTSDVDGDVFDWDSEDEREIANIPVSNSTVVVPAFDPGEASSSGSKQFDTFMRMGFPERLVARVLQESGDKDENYIVERLLEYSMELEGSPEGQQALETPPEEPQIEPDSLSSEYEDNCLSLSDVDSFSDFEDVAIPDCGDNSKKMGLLAMGYTINEASNAIARCDVKGNNSTYDELIDFILAARTVKEEDGNYPLEVNPRPPQTKRRFEHEMKKHKKQRGDRSRAPTEDDELIRPPNPMIGFGVPTESFDPIPRTIPEPAVGPPYFYYENVALAPKGVWSAISRFLYDVEPEFVDSKYFCAAARKRGYVHNLPIANRYPLLPLPPRTITEALPMTRRWWPAWDTRTKLNCLQTCVASAKLTERIRKSLEPHEDEPPLSVQRYVLEECRKWNLVWVGRNKLAPLEPDEVEMLLGFPKNHTRGGGISRTDRYKSLGNSFQVDTVAYHLSVLKDMFPNGINILSLFSGIGGAEVALHRLGVRIKNVVSVEKSDVNRSIVRSWWEQTNQKGALIDWTDVQTVDDRMLEQYVSRLGGFDLVVGGSPCNNLAGSNRHHRDGLEGAESSLFYDYFRILELVKNIQRPR